MMNPHFIQFAALAHTITTINESARGHRTTRIAHKTTTKRKMAKASRRKNR